MSSAQAAPPPPGAGSGGAGRGRDARADRRRRKNWRYHRNRAARSHLRILCWNAEGLRPKTSELQSWLPTANPDILAFQECQFGRTPIRLAGYQPPVVTRRARGRTAASTKGGDVALYVRAGLHFTCITGSPVAPTDDTTEVCGVRLLGLKEDLTIINIYRPPIRTGEADERQDRFDPNCLPADNSTVILGDVNAHHPLWDHGCEAADAVGDRLAEWFDRVGWTTLNSGAATHASYRSGAQTTPDIAACSSTLAPRVAWTLGPDLGSDHLPMLLEVRGAGNSDTTRRKTRWAFRRADWPAFQRACEAAFEEADLEHLSVEEQANLFTRTVQETSKVFIPRGARPGPKPWKLDPAVQEAARERQAARRELRAGVPGSKERWVTAKQRAAKAEREASQAHFRKFVETELSKPASLGRITRLLRSWEEPSQHREGETMVAESGKILTTDREKAEAFNKTYAGVARQVRVPTLDRAVKRKLANPALRHCSDCGGERVGCCAPFSEGELLQQLNRCSQKKAPGPDEICTEHLIHLGPRARSVLLSLINASWKKGEVPSCWRRATVIPIPKTGKDKRKIPSYRPIALTSHVSKLAERMVLARLNHIVAEKRLIPPEQVGFREGRAVEDNIARLTQLVQDGWNLPKFRGGAPPSEGTTAQKYALVAFDFARAYDTVDHRMLRLRLLEMGIPPHYVNWLWSFLRDRRARVEVGGTKSKERIYRAGLPQGSVVSPTLFLLWSAPLAAALQEDPGTTAFMYADDTAALCAGYSLEVARTRAQRAADVLVNWAAANKMRVAGEKTQLLVLSQWHRDKDCEIQVAGQPVRAGEQLKLLGVTLDRLLHFGPHCRALKQRTRPRLQQLRKLSGRSWGLSERHLKTVAQGYVRGAMEHAAAAWLPATSASHAEILEREMRMAARIITGCPLSTPREALMAEAGLDPMATRGQALAARLLAKALALPEGDPLQTVALAEPPKRLKHAAGWRDLGRDVWRRAGVTGNIEPTVSRRPPPWSRTEGITFTLDVGPLPLGASGAQKKAAAELRLGGLPQCATWAWSDGSAEGGTSSGGAGAWVVRPDGEEEELRAPAGRLCSSFRAEMTALAMVTDWLRGREEEDPEDPVVICTDSQSALATLRSGPSAQQSYLGAAIWDGLLALTARGHEVHLQWVPSHCDLAGNERADVLAKEAARLPQDRVLIDCRTVLRAAMRTAREQDRKDRPGGWYRDLMGTSVPPPVSIQDRGRAVDVHQLRAGHWSASFQYRLRIGVLPTPTCGGCASLECGAARCPLCREAADTPRHVLRECPALMVRRHQLVGNISPDLAMLRSEDVVAALAAAVRTLQSRMATGGN